jgi:hypothetical protein
VNCANREGQFQLDEPTQAWEFWPVHCRSYRYQLFNRPGAGPEGCSQPVFLIATVGFATMTLMEMSERQRVSNLKSPIVICGTGGSGSRVIVRILRRAGCFFGANLNDAEDSQFFPKLYDRWVNRYVLRKIAPLCREEKRLMLRDFTAAVARHRFAMRNDNDPWGWKEPRSIFFLPFLNRQWPGARFIHIIRDGRDMAFSTNQNQLRKHGPSVLGAEITDAPDPVKSAFLWARLNTEAASYGEVHMAGRYLRVKFERLCTNPQETIVSIFRFLDLPRVELDLEMVCEVSAPRSIGRWETEGSPSVIDSIYSGAGAALKRFGYI